MFKRAKLFSGVLKRSDNAEMQKYNAPVVSFGERLSRSQAAKQVRSTQPTRVETRASHRFVPRRTTTWLTTVKGKKIDARIINVSAMGVAVETDLSAACGEAITMVGSRPVKQGRRMSLGMIYMFETALDENLCRPELVL